MVSNTRLYGTAIAVASGAYSLWQVVTAPRMTASGWLMGILGVVVIVHGALLVTDVADRLGDASGPLMIAYAAVMLLLQALSAAGVTTMDGREMGMETAMEMGGNAGMGWDPGMVVLALLMLASGLIMRRPGEPM